MANIISSLGDLTPYVTLALLIIGLFVIRSRKITAVLLAVQIFLGFVYEILNPMGLFAIASFWGICTLHWRHLSSKEWVNTLRVLFIAAIGIAFAAHMIPGFYNKRVFDAILISPHAALFTMYLNFDKTSAAAVLMVASGLLLKQKIPFGMQSWRDTLMISALCIPLLLSLALLSGYVNFDPKFPDSFWLWAFNNLLFVCFAEEAIFRGIIQTHLMQIANQHKITPFVPIVVSSLLFGAAHFYGGPILMAFATIAGLFYGYAYHHTKRLESAIVVHFMVNLCHFLFFSYPMVAVIVK